MAKEFTSENFEMQVLGAKGPVLVDFWASWCMPCRMQAPAVDQLAEEGYQVGKVDVDAQSSLAARYQVMNIPTLIVFKDGQEAKRLVGVQSKEELIAALDSCQ